MMPFLTTHFYLLPLCYIQTSGLIPLILSLFFSKNKLPEGKGFTSYLSHSPSAQDTA